MIFLVFLNVFVIILTISICSTSTKFGAFKASAINPVNFFAFLQFFFVLDFYFLHQTLLIDIFETKFVVTEQMVYQTFLIYTVFNVVFLITTYFYLNKFNVYSEKLDNQIQFVKSDNLAKYFFFSICFLLFLSFLANFHLFVAMLNGEFTRQVLFRENKLLTIITSLLIPSYAFYVSTVYRKNKNIIVATSIVIFITFISGSRGNILFVLIIVAVILSVRGKKFNFAYLFLSIPIIGYALLVSRYYLREAWNFNSFDDFISTHGSPGEIFFKGSEISMAEVLVTVNTFSESLQRFPFESFYAGLVFFVPRSLFTEKPYGSGGVLTEALSPDRWMWTKSEIITTGYGDLIMQFGILFSFPIFILMLILWLRAVLRTVNSSPRTIIIFLPFLLWWGYLFLRADVFDTCISIWYFVLVWLCHRAIYAFFYKRRLHY